MKISGWLAILLMMATTAWGAGADNILGIWKTEQGESLVEIFTCGEKLCGKVIWLKDPLYTDSKDGTVGTPFIDRKNPDPSIRNRPIIGLRVLKGFAREGNNTWGGGTCYDPKSGKTYRGKIRRTATDRLELRGYVGIPLFGRTSVWTR